MTATVEDLRRLFYDPSYQAALVEVCAAINLGLDNDIPPILYDIDISDLHSASLNLTQLASVFESDKARFKDFVLIKLRALAQHPDEQEYPPAEEPDMQDVAEEQASRSNVRACPNFLLGHLIEYWLLKNDPGRLAPYLKLNRVPQAKKYEKQLREYYMESV